MSGVSMRTDDDNRVSFSRGRIGTSTSTPVAQRAPEVIELVETTLKTRLLIERDVPAAQSRPAESGKEHENVRDA